MKLRLKGNSVRLRLSSADVEKFGTTGIVTETVHFGASKLTYSLETNSKAKTIAAHFADNRITVLIPVSTAKKWVDSEQISLMCEQSIESGVSGNELEILIEKDLACHDKNNSSDSLEAFSYPAKTALNTSNTNGDFR
jgi:hypothetical protein